jgi:hypothetical protein
VRKFKVMLAVALAVAMMSLMAPAAFAQSASFDSPLLGGIHASAGLDGAHLSALGNTFDANTGDLFGGLGGLVGGLGGL